MADFRTVSTHSAPRAEVLNAYMRGVYQWMAGGLGLTALVAYMVASTPALQNAIIYNPILFWGLIIAEFGLVMGISGGISKLSASTASGLFLLYSAINGATLSVILTAYTESSIAGTFVICAGMFGAMSIYGMVTKKDLTSMGSFMFMGLIGIILASVVNIFLQSPGLNFAISGIGVLVFVGLTAYDTQKLKVMGQSAPMNDATAVRRGTILGALTLYLDFINLFLMLLRFFGQGRD
jgi:FtsH-binding integral membrane protein